MQLIAAKTLCENLERSMDCYLIAWFVIFWSSAVPDLPLGISANKVSKPNVETEKESRLQGLQPQNPQCSLQLSLLLSIIASILPELHWTSSLTILSPIDRCISWNAALSLEYTIAGKATAYLKPFEGTCQQQSATDESHPDPSGAASRAPRVVLWQNNTTCGRCSLSHYGCVT